MFRPFVPLAVALILFEDGLSLRFDEIRGSGAVVRNYEVWGNGGAATIVALVFPTIALTEAFYGLVASSLARLVGASRLGREIGMALPRLGVDVLLVGPTSPRGPRRTSGRSSASDGTAKR